MMSKTEQLFIRACKGKNSQERLVKIYRRFYCTTNDTIMYYSLAEILTCICQKYVTIRLSELISDYHPLNHWKFGIDDKDDHWMITIKILTSYIRLTKVSDFGEEFITPAKFRNLWG